MRIVMASDHGGYDLKEELKEYIESMGHEISDVGTYSKESCDYPVFGKKAAKAVKYEEADTGIVICGTGIGISLSCNKIKGIRCALCANEYSARMARRHNNANMLALGARVIGADLAKSIVKTFLEEEFEGGRHQRRLDMIEWEEEI